MSRKLELEDITISDILDWIGNPGYAELQIDFMVQTLRDIINGDLSPDQLYQDIYNYKNQ